MNVKEILSQMSLEDKVKICSGADFWGTKAFEKYGIKQMYFSDGPSGLRRQLNAADHLGVNNSEPSTCFPAACLTGSTWNRSLLKQVGQAIGEEALELKADVVLGPGVNIKRNPLCGRNFEYFSEDPILAGEMGAAWIQGCESTGRGTSLKHFAANNQEAERLLSDSLVDEQTLREIYLKPFEIAVRKGNPATVMCSYNKINGTYMSDNIHLNQDILRKEWGFDGVMVTDWGAMNNRVASIKAGIDIEMPSSNGFFDQQLLDALQTGELTEAELDTCLERLLTLIFEKQAKRIANYHYDKEEHHQLARKAAEEGAVLLKNESAILPLNKNEKVALIGAMAKESRYQGAGSSHINPLKLVSIEEAFHQANLNYQYAPGYEVDGSANVNYQEAAVEIAKNSEVAVIVAGLPAVYESEGYDRKNMQMPQSHIDLIQAVSKVNPNVIVVLCGGSPVEMPWEKQAKGILNMYLAGQALGEACVNLLFGQVNPSGKLAETYPMRYQDVVTSEIYGVNPRQAEYREGLYVGYRYYQKANVAVRYPFGFGLSYTTFEYSQVKLEGQQLRFTLKNSGDMDGSEVVQLYVANQTGLQDRPIRELKDFQKVFLKAGESKEISFDIVPEMFAIFDVHTHDWQTLAGHYVLEVAASSEDIRLTMDYYVTQGQKAAAALTDNWYTSLIGKPTREDFETRYGQKIEPYHAPKVGEYTLMSTLNDMKDSPTAQYMLAEIKKSIGVPEGQEPNEEQIFLIEITSNTPLQRLAQQGGSSELIPVYEQVVMAANAGQ